VGGGGGGGGVVGYRKNCQSLCRVFGLCRVESVDA
jgi:hypothetical protein